MAFLVEFPTLHGETLGKSLGVNMGPMVIHPLRRGDNRLGLGAFLPFITLVGWTFGVTEDKVDFRNLGAMLGSSSGGVVKWEEVRCNRKKLESNDEPTLVESCQGVGSVARLMHLPVVKGDENSSFL